MNSTLTNTALLQLLRLASPALPIGAYSYSQGLEYACQAGWVKNAADAADWFGGIMQEGLARLDIPVLIRMYHAWEQADAEQAVCWSQYLLACRETRELRQEDRQTGRSLGRLLRDMNIEQAQVCLPAETASLALSFSLAAYAWQIPLTETACGYLWSWLENQVAAAIKLMPLGQTQGQKILSACIPLIEAYVQRGLTTEDNEIYGGLPGFALASMFHETQYSRLFQS